MTQILGGAEPEEARFLRYNCTSFRKWESFIVFVIEWFSTRLTAGNGNWDATLWYREEACFLVFLFVGLWVPDAVDGPLYKRGSAHKLTCLFLLKTMQLYYSFGGFSAVLSVWVISLVVWFCLSLQSSSPRSHGCFPLSRGQCFDLQSYSVFTRFACTLIM